MTRKDYTAIADVFIDMLADPKNDKDTLWRVIRSLLPVFKQDNPRFNSAKFIDYIKEGSL